jgi:hypothetical protein
VTTIEWIANFFGFSFLDIVSHKINVTEIGFEVTIDDIDDRVINLNLNLLILLEIL